MKKTSPIKKLYNSRAFWLIISLLASLAIWIYVTSSESTEIRQVFRNVRVDIVGEETLLSSREMVVTDLSASTVTVEVVGPRRIIGVMDSSDLVAQVDVSKLSQTGSTTAKYEIVYPSGTDKRNITEVAMRPSTLSFVVSKLTQKTVPVRGGFEGELAEGYLAETPDFQPSTIVITGPENYIKNIDHAWVTFGKGVVAESTYSVESGYTLMDENDKPCSTENILSFSSDTVTATLPILESKRVDLAVDLIEGAGANSQNTKVTIEPSSVLLAGDSAILAGINRIVLDTVDLTDFAVSNTETYAIPINNDLKNISGVSDATVTIEIVGLETKTFKIRNISCINVAEGSTAEIISESLDVTIRGPVEQLEQIKSENIRAVADLADFKDSTGVYMPSVKIYVDGVTGVGAIGENAVSVEIRKA